MLGAEPILFVVAVFATTDFIQLIGSLFYPGCLLRWKSIWHHYRCIEGSLRGESNIGLRLFAHLGNGHLGESSGGCD